MWSNILTKPPKGRGLRDFRSELINCSVDYKEESNCGDVDKTTGVSDVTFDTKGEQTGKYNARYMSYAESTR